MQELISKEDLKKIFDNHLIRLSAHFWTYKELIKVRDDINSLPTTVHHEHKVGEEYSFSNDWINWVAKAQLHWIRYETETMDWYYIRPFPPTPAEHPDITQARELASKHWMILIPKE